jgi:hypothetical protein
MDAAYPRRRTASVLREWLISLRRCISPDTASAAPWRR